MAKESRHNGRMKTLTSGWLALAVTGLVAVGCKPPSQAGRVGGAGPAVGGGGPSVGGTSSDPSSPIPRLTSGGSGSAPNSVGPGTRMTFLTTTETIANDISNWIPDPNGTWTNPKTGEKMRREVRPGGSGASAGYNVYDVVAIEDGQALIATNTYGIIDNIAPRSLRGGSIVGSAGFGAGMWADPALLQTIPDIAGNDRVVHMPYDLGGKKIDALWIDSSLPVGHEVRVYDLASGLLVHLGSSSTGTPSEFKAPDETGNPGGFLAFSTITNVRKISVPWANDPIPEWAQNLNTMEFAGTETLAMPGAPQSIVVATAMKMTVEAKGASWIKVMIDATREAGPGGHASSGKLEMITGQSQVNPFWIAPATLASLRPGQQIDQDDLLKITTVVGQRENLGRGEALAISRTGPSEQSDWLYDLQTGMLVGIRQINKATFTTTMFTLKSTS